MNVDQTNACSKLTKMDCYKAGGGCCASNSDGTGTVSAAKACSSEEICGYCFTGEPAAAISTTQGKHRRGNIGVGTGGGSGGTCPHKLQVGGAVPPQPKPCQDAVLGLTMIHSMNIDSSRVYST